MSIPYALSSEHIYKARIEQIDGMRVAAARRHPLTAGKHTLTVSPLLDIDWSPDLVENPSIQTRSKQFTLVVEPGRSYQVAVKVDIEADAESQLDQSFWEPFVYSVREN